MPARPPTHAGLTPAAPMGFTVGIVRSGKRGAKPGTIRFPGNGDGRRYGCNGHGDARERSLKDGPWDESASDPVCRNGLGRTSEIWEGAIPGERLPKP